MEGVLTSSIFFTCVNFMGMYNISSYFIGAYLRSANEREGVGGWSKSLLGKMV